jgi:hypothetical protein
MHRLFPHQVHDEQVRHLNAVSVVGSATIVLAGVNLGKVRRIRPSLPSDRPSGLSLGIALQRTPRT